jgi:hypothetical protein
MLARASNDPSRFGPSVESAFSTLPSRRYSASPVTAIGMPVVSARPVDHRSAPVAESKTTSSAPYRTR